MEQERYDNIEYNEEWQSVPVERAEPVGADFDNENNEILFDDEDYSEKDNQYIKFEGFMKNRKSSAPQPVIKLQFLISILALILAFGLKNFGGEIYNMAKDWYFKNLNNSLIAVLQKDVEEQTTKPTENVTEKVSIYVENVTESITNANEQPTEVVTIASAEETTEEITGTEN